MAVVVNAASIVAMGQASIVMPVGSANIAQDCTDKLAHCIPSRR
jgi:hypothetical protein